MAVRDRRIKEEAAQNQAPRGSNPHRLRLNPKCKALCGFGIYPVAIAIGNPSTKDQPITRSWRGPFIHGHFLQTSYLTPGSRWAKVR